MMMLAETKRGEVKMKLDFHLDNGDDGDCQEERRWKGGDDGGSASRSWCWFSSKPKTRVMG